MVMSDSLADSIQHRKRLGDSNLVVVKIGSAVLTEAGRLNKKAITRLGSDIAALKRSGRQVVIVSSGAVASGLNVMGLQVMPKAIVDKQAAAAIGQQVLMNAWADSLKKYRFHVAQVLLTSADLDNRSRYLNARHTLQALINQGVVPIVNENDSVTFDEIKLGDNDHLSALVTTLVSADLLVMLTDVEGLREGGPHGPLLRTIEAGQCVNAHIRSAKSSTGTGGMKTKVDAARLVGDAGISAIIAPGGRKDVLQAIISGEQVGTLFEPNVRSLNTRRRWIATATRPKGVIRVDAGAVKAIVERNASLLPSGIVKVEGRFAAGDAIRIADRHGEAFARGLVSYNSEEVERIKGCRSAELPGILGYHYMNEIVHRDDLVVEKR